MHLRYGKTTKKTKNGHDKSKNGTAPQVKKELAPPATGAGSEAGPSENKSDGDADDMNRKLAKRERHIKKLEKALRQCGRKIQELDEAEMDLDALEDENSPYLMMTRYQKRFMSIHHKIAELKQLNASLKRKCDKRIKIETSRIPEVNAKIEELINKKKQFPDFADVHGFYKSVNAQLNLGMSKEIVYHDGEPNSNTLRARLF